MLVSQEQANGGRRQQQSFGVTLQRLQRVAALEANRVAASRRLWHTRLAMLPSPQAASNVNNHKQYQVICAESPASEVPKIASHFVNCGASAVSGSVAVIPPCLCLASAGLCWPCWPAFGGGGRLGLWSARGRLGRAGCSPTNQLSTRQSS